MCTHTEAECWKGVLIHLHFFVSDDVMAFSHYRTGEWILHGPCFSNPHSSIYILWGKRLKKCCWKPIQCYLSTSPCICLNWATGATERHPIADFFTIFLDFTDISNSHESAGIMVQWAWCIHCMNSSEVYSRDEEIETSIGDVLICLPLCWWSERFITD